MKKALLLLFICFCHFLSFCQSNAAVEEKQFSTALLAATQNFSPQAPVANISPSPAIKVPESVLLRLNLPDGSLRPPVAIAPAAISGVGSHQRTANANCQDTSYRHFISIYNCWIYIRSVIQTADSNILVTAMLNDSTRLPHPSWRGYGLLLKMNESGQVLWTRMLSETSPGDYSFFSMSNAFELSNQDIVCTALWNPNNSNVYKTMVYRFSSTGNIIWKNCLQNNLRLLYLPAGALTFYAESATEGLNGDILLCGTTSTTTSWASAQTVVRLNNMGQVVWDANFSNCGVDGSYMLGTAGATAFVNNGQVVLIGVSHGRSYPLTGAAINLIKLDYNNGQLLTKRFFKPDYTTEQDRGDKSFFWSWNKWIRLYNGHYLFYGKLNSDLLNLTMVKDHFGVVEFDATFNLLQSYTINTHYNTTTTVDFLKFDTMGRGLVHTFQSLNFYECNIYLGSFNHYNRQFQHQRKAYYPDISTAGYNGFAFLHDNGYAFVQTVYESPPIGARYFEFRKMHDSDTSSVCMGKDTSVYQFGAMRMVEDPTYPFLDPIVLNKMVSIPITIFQSGIPTATVQLCTRQTNSCDTVKIHGNPIICGSNTSSIFTAFKNNGCGATVQWNISSNNAVDSMKVLNDSSVKIWFRNANWQGYLYASLSGNACASSITDSIAISIVRQPEAVRLGADTILCNQQSLVLHAGINYAHYTWQNGSTDSTLTVVAPGLYWVQVRDGCGNISSDSIVVSPFNTAISIGADRIKCNSDTLHLAAPSGFLNYAWSNNYNISSLTAQNVTVNPLADTAYYIKAEKIPGCFAYDTVHITVYQSPVIHLGNDTSFCSGNSIVLNAGSNFQIYQWNTGATSQQINATTTGTYSILATTLQGCKSSDTLKVLTLFPLPVVSLDKVPGLCAGTSKILDAGSFSSYLWSTGASNRTITVNNIGLYTVHVTDANGCTGVDTTHITTLYPLPTSFLPADTSICSYGTLQLKPLSDYRIYLWSTGMSSPSITINKPGTYWLQAMNENNCVGKDTIYIGLKDCLKGFYIPSAFTPNNDGKNDVFRPMIFGVIKHFSFRIYNRWGQVVFQTNNSQAGWNGKLAGNPVASGVYIWNCTYQLAGEDLKTEKGTVVLID